LRDVADLSIKDFLNRKDTNANLRSQELYCLTRYSEGDAARDLHAPRLQARTVAKTSPLAQCLVGTIPQNFGTGQEQPSLLKHQPYTAYLKE